MTSTTETRARSVEDRLDEFESRTAVSGLVAGYCEGVDRKNIGRFMDLWHADAAYLIPGGRGDFHGTEEIRKSQEVIGRAWRETYHWTTNHTVTFDHTDRALGRSDVFAMCTHHDGRVSYVGGTYDDVYERREGVWKFSERKVTRWFVSAPVDIELLPAY